MPKARTKARRKTAFVPSVVFSTVVVGVVPACVVSACGGTTMAQRDAGSDAPSEAVGASEVASVCFGEDATTCPPCCSVGAVAYTAFDSGPDADAGDAAADAPADSPADATQPDVVLGVAAVAFCGFCDGGDEEGG